MRDSIKDAKYFTEYIEYSSNRLHKWLDKYKLADNDRSKHLIRRYICNEGLRLVIAKYSAGYSISDIKKSYKSIISYIGENKEYNDCIKILSLSVLLDVKIPNVKNVIPENYENDCVLNFLVDGNSNSKPESSGYLPLLKMAVTSGDKAIACDCINKYLSSWYNSNKSAYWYDSHKSANCVYNGYWCFEAAAIAKLLQISSSSLEKNKFYPKDLY